MKRIKHISYILLSGIALLSSCQKEEAYGYLKIGMDTLVSTVETKVSPVPAGYDPRTLHVEIIDADNKVIKSTDDFDNDSAFKEKVQLLPGTYTIVAHSAGWDGSQSAFDAPYYYGSTTATVELKKVKDASIVCTLANVKVSVNFDEAFREYFNSAKATVSSALESVNPLAFAMSDASPKIGYFPAGNLALKIEVENKEGKSFSQENTILDVQPRQYIKINYRFEKEHTTGITVKYDDTENAYNWTIPIVMSEEEENPPAQGVSLSCSSPSYIWGHYVSLAATVGEGEFEQDKVVLLWREKGTENWNTIENSDLSYDSSSRTYSITKFDGLEANKDYEYMAQYGDATSRSNTISFKTQQEEQIYNGGFETWTTVSRITNANASGVTYWGSSNNSTSGNNTTKSSAAKHSGEASAKLANKSVLGILASGSIFTGKFISLIDMAGAKLDWGVPFTSRPTALKGYLSYFPGKINCGSAPSGIANVPAKNSNDVGQIFCVLLHTTDQNNSGGVGPLRVGGNAENGDYKKSTTIDWENDPRVVAYGIMILDGNDATANYGSVIENVTQFVDFSIDLEYHRTDITPNYMAIVCSASKFGDYFYGSDTSVLYVDDFSFEYGDTPKVKGNSQTILGK